MADVRSATSARSELSPLHHPFFDERTGFSSAEIDDLARTGISTTHGNITERAVLALPVAQVLLNRLRDIGEGSQVGGDKLALERMPTMLDAV